jgi:hypothetical protein
MLTNLCRGVIMNNKLSKKEKEAIKDKRPSRTMSAEEWAEVQGMTQAELRGRSTGFKEFIKKMDENK